MITSKIVMELITDDMLEEIAHRYNEARNTNYRAKGLDGDIGDIIVFALDQHIDEINETDSYEFDSACIDADNANFINQEL